VGQFLQIAETILRNHGKPMKARDIVDLAKDQSLFSDKLSGKTPHQTMKAKISVDIRQKGVNSRFIRTAPGTFFLRDLLVDPSHIYEAVPQTRPGAGEHVLVFSSTLLDKAGRFQGITRAWRRFLTQTLTDKTCASLSRLHAEQTEEWKQLLTYVIVTRRDQILCFRRGSFNRVEDYLRGSLCVGFGGHVSEADRTLYNFNDYKEIVLGNAVRELYEELSLPIADKKRLSAGEGLQIMGLLNDDSSSTGRKHLAVVLKYEVGATDEWDHPERGEKSITQLEWLSTNSFNRELKDFEYWSQLCLAEFFEDAIKTQPSYVIRRRTPFQGPHLLCIVGGIGSGKSAATKLLTQHFNYTEINSGRVVAELINIPPVPETNREEFQKQAWRFIKRPTGPAKLARALLRHAKASTPPVLIDGIRQRATLTELRKQAGVGKVAVLFIHTPPHVAYKFYSDRSQGGLDLGEFLRLCDAPVEADVRKLISVADAVLYNWTGRLKYEEAIRSLMAEVK
jgi:predicted NUDIX family phosphoesterase/dephospho-CoA kinase